MYKQVVIFSLLAAAATTFPSSGLDDLGPSRPDGQVLPAENKSFNQIAESSGNPVELIEASANITAKTRKTRGCVLTIAATCSESSVNATILLDHQRKMENVTLAFATQNSENMLKKILIFLDNVDRRRTVHTQTEAE